MASGLYTIKVTDNLSKNFAQTIAPILVSQPEKLKLSVVNKDVSCNGDSNGEIHLSASGGIQSYNYTIGVQSAYTKRNLIKGNYTCKVVDDNGCYVEKVVPVKEPESLSLSKILT